MRSLVIHDRQTIAEEIAGIIESVGGASQPAEIAGDYLSARAALSDHIFDLVIVDLTIPFSQTMGEANYQAVAQLLHEIFDLGTLNPPGDVIGITKELQMLPMVAQSVGPHLMTAIEEDAKGEWRQILSDKIKYAFRSAVTRQVSVMQHYNYDALIVTAMDAEFKPYRDIFDLQSVSHFPGLMEFLFNDRQGVRRRGLAFSIGRSGQPSAASYTQALITLMRPKLVLMSGYCGGVKGKVELGDLVVFDAAYAWDYGKWSEEKKPDNTLESVFKSRPDPVSVPDACGLLARAFVGSQFNKEPKLLERVKEKAMGKLEKFEMFHKPVGSGSAVVANDEIINQIRGLNESIWAIDMESYGFYHAAKFTPVIKPAYLCIKSVSDYCNGEKGDELHAACSLISATAIERVLTELWDF